MENSEEGQFNVVKLTNSSRLGTNLNAQNMNGMTQLEFAVHCGKYKDGY